MKTLHGFVVFAGSVAAVAAGLSTPVGDRWNPDEIEVLASLRLSELGPVPADPTNRYADDPLAAELGQHLFFDERFSANGKVSCATCHSPELDFQDGKPLAEGIGTTTRRTMPIASTAYTPWLFWDGRKDSQWSQALGPLESPVEHGGTRAQYAHLVATHYGPEYEVVFGPLPDLSDVPEKAGPVDESQARDAWDALSASRQDAVNRVFANVGKAIAAYERKIQYGVSRFDLYLEGLVEEGRAPANVLSADEVEGARLFIGDAGCVNCHNGPLFTDDYFHNTGVPSIASLAQDRGRSDGAIAVLADEFNCRGRYSDATPESCHELEYMVVDSEELVRAFKTPSLRNVAVRSPYMHAGQFATLEEVVRHYSRAPKAPAGRSELHRLRLNDREIRQIVSFLESLTAPLSAPPELSAGPHE